MTAQPSFWDKLAERYARQPVADEEAFRRKKDITRRYLTPEGEAVEIGCGTGSLALELASSVGHVHAIDFSAEMLRIARGKADAQGVSNVTFHQASAEAMPAFEPGRFECALAFSILHLVDDRRELLRTLHDLLQPGGTLVSSTVCLGGSWVPYGMILPVMKLLGQAPTVHILEPADVERDMRDAGFVDIQAPDVGAQAQVCFMVAKRPA